MKSRILEIGMMFAVFAFSLFFGTTSATIENDTISNTNSLSYLSSNDTIAENTNLNTSISNNNKNLTAPSIDNQTVNYATITGSNFSFVTPYVDLNGIPIMEGDIIVDKSLKDPAQAAFDRFIYNNMWPNGEIPYIIDTSVPLNKTKFIEDAISVWESQTPIRFIDLNSAGVNSFMYPDYVKFVPEYSEHPGASCAVTNIGKQSSGGEQLALIYPKCQMGNLIHEIGHLVGLWHEHQRPDRDQHVRIVNANIIPEERSYLQFATPFCNKVTNICDYPRDDLTEYDYCSIMHYGETAFSRDPSSLRTIIPLHPERITECTKIGQRDNLSSVDINAVNEIYGSSSISSGPQGETSGTYTLYSDPYFNIELPIGYTLSGPFTIAREYSVYFMTTGIPFIDPMGVSIQRVSPFTTLDRQVSDAKERWAAIMEEGDKISSERNMVIKGNHAVSLTYEYSDEVSGDVGILEAIYLLKGGNLFEITYEINQADFERYTPMIQHIVNSLDIIGE